MAFLAFNCIRASECTALEKVINNATNLENVSAFMNIIGADGNS